MIYTFLLSIFLPLILGLLLVFSFWSAEKETHHLLVKGSLALGLGMGILSILFFLWLVTSGMAPTGFVFFENVLLVIVVIAFLFLMVTKRLSFPHVTPGKPFTGIIFSYWLYIGIFILLIDALSTFLSLSFRYPLGGWDALGIWNLHAKFIFMGGTNWADIFFSKVLWSHPDYPLLIPLIVANGWLSYGHETPLVPQVLGMVFTFSVVFLLYSSLTVLRIRSQGLLAGLVLLGSPFFIKHGASQYADTPLSFFFLSVLVMFSFYDELSKNNHRLLILAGIAAGLSAWTKNEGILFLVAIFSARALAIIPINGYRVFLRQMVFFLMGLVPVLATIIFFKIRFAPPSDIVSGLGITMFDKLTNPSRHIQILQAYMLRSINFTEGLVSFPLLILFLFLVGKNRERSVIIDRFLLFTLLFMFTGYYFIYLTTSNDIGWLLETSLQRLFVQLWPSVIFYFFMTVNVPEKLLASSKY